MTNFFKIFVFAILFLAVGISLGNISNLKLQLQQQEITFSGKLDELSAYQQTLVNRISLLEENFSALKRSHEELQVAYDLYIQDSTIERENLQTTVNSLYATISELEINSDVDKNQIAELREEVSALEISLENQTTTANQFKATVEQQEVTINNLNTRIDSLIEELNSDLITITAFQNLLDGSENVILTAEDLGDISSVRPYAFYGVTNLISIDLPSTCLYIDNGAFSYCENIITVNAESVESIGNTAFGNCSSLQNVRTSNALTVIGQTAFSGCFSLVEIDLGSVRTLANNAFANCSSLETIVRADQVESIGSSVFSGCSSLTSFNFPVVQTIGANAFNNCNFNVLNLPPTLTNVGNYAFQNNLNLIEVIMPDSIISQGNNIFAYCSNLEKMTVPFIGTSAEQSIDTEELAFSWFFGTSGNSDMYSVRQHYKRINLNTFYTGYIPNSLKEITVLGGNLGAGAFENMNLVEKIDVSKTTWIDPNGTFYSCTHLTDFAMPETISTTVIDSNAFAYTSSLEYIVIPEGITELGDSCFRGSGIKAISLPSTLIKLAGQCFSNLRNSVNILLPESLVYVCDYTFGWSYSNHVNIYIPNLANLQYLTDYNYDKLFYDNGHKITLYTGSSAVPDIYPEKWNYDESWSTYVEVKFNYTAEQFLAEVSA